MYFMKYIYSENLFEFFEENRENLQGELKYQKGGLSGKPLEIKSNQLISKFYDLFANSNKYKSKNLIIDDPFDFGYIFFGPLVFNYLYWLINNCNKNNINIALIMARTPPNLSGIALKIA